MGTAAAERDSDVIVWFKRAAVAHDVPLGIGDNAVTAGQYGLRVEVAEAGRQAVEVAAFGIQCLAPFVVQFGLEGFEAGAQSSGLRAGQQEASGQAGERVASACGGAAQSVVQAALQVKQLFALAGEAVCRVHKAMVEQVKLLIACFEHVLHPAAQI